MRKNPRTEVPKMLAARPVVINRPHVATPEAKAARAAKLDAWTSGKRKNT
jgi:hypothetical protein